MHTLIIVYLIISLHSRYSVAWVREPHHTSMDMNVICVIVTLRWRHDEHDGVSNHHPRDCLLNRSFRPNFRPDETVWKTVNT